MEFKDGADGRLASELSKLVQPDLRQLLYDVDWFCASQKMPGVVVTQLVRTVDEQIAIYVPFWRGLAMRFDGGEHMTPSLAKLAIEVADKPEDYLRAKAINQFTWHLVRCAADIRIRHWTKDQLKQVVSFVSEKAKDSRLWEFLVHDVSGPHMHIGIRDFSFRSRFDPRKGETK